MTTTLQPTQISTRDLTHTDGIWTAEASSLPTPSPIYDDACDLGFTLVNSKGERRVLRAEHHEYDNHEGDLLWTDYRPLDPRGGWPTFGFLVRVFND